VSTTSLLVTVCIPNY